MIRFRTNQPYDHERAILENLGPLYGFAMSLARNPVDAEDLVQEACLRAIKGMPQDGIKSDPKVWLFTILRNVWINEWRRRANGPEFLLLEKGRGDFLPPQERLADQRACPEDYLEWNALREKVRVAISGLPEAFREVIVLRYFEGFSYRQIASIVGCPAGTIMSRLSRARAELRNVLKEKEPLMVLQRKRGLG
ncbi:MAG TPA: RNA polymerase sigma factor [Candidatus Binatia bacterium]|nr:RNA polymerase sigma factor [Candidatus Binatia bacterium]